MRNAFVCGLISFSIRNHSVRSDKLEVVGGKGTNLSAPSGHLPLKGEARRPPVIVAFLAPPLGELARST